MSENMSEFLLNQMGNVSKICPMCKKEMIQIGEKSKFLGWYVPNYKCECGVKAIYTGSKHYFYNKNDEILTVEDMPFRFKNKEEEN